LIIEDTRTRGEYPPDRPGERKVTPMQQAPSIAEKAFDLSETLFEKIGKVLKALFALTFRILIAGITAYIAMWVYPDGFMATPFSNLTPGDIFSFIFSIILWLLAFIFLFR